MKKDVKRLILLYHLLAVFWSLLMMPLDIDNEKCREFYMEYAKMRLDMYND
jgi:hypothetical protein